MATPSGTSNVVLIRDLMILLLKLIIDGVKDALLIQLAIGGVVLDVLFGRPDRPLLFYRVLRLGERFDLWLNLYGAADGAEASGDGLFGASRAGAHTLLGRLEQLVRQRVEEFRAAPGAGGRRSQPDSGVAGTTHEPQPQSAAGVPSFTPAEPAGRGYVTAFTLPLLSALVAGCLHALEADHLAAVTTFVSRRPHPVKALGFGVRWGLGHSAMLLVAGGVLILLDLRLPESLVIGLEAGVGVLLVALGVWVLADVAHGRAMPGAHETAHARGHRHGHLHGSTWVGAAHGLAGTAGFLALIPATMLASPWLAGGYLALFGVGTVVSMGAYALAAGLVFHRAGVGAPLVARFMRCLAGAASGAVGCLWILRALA